MDNHKKEYIEKCKTVFLEEQSHGKVIVMYHYEPDKESVLYEPDYNPFDPAYAKTKNRFRGWKRRGVVIAVKALPGDPFPYRIGWSLCATHLGDSFNRYVGLEKAIQEAYSPHKKPVPWSLHPVLNTVKERAEAYFK